ncbi:MAG TPA: dihydrofolate reductase family protein [Gemmatimonadales bacterium]|nr:dihydrofolate reductase family protein [Gemmatimonadales bacterium]
MRRVVLKMHVSLDGYVRDAGGEVMDWIFRTYDDELARWEVELLSQAGTHVMGRRLYEEMAAHWPTSTEVYARPMNEIPKVVFSRTLQHATWQHTRITDGDPAEELARLRQEPGKDILVHGGAAFAQSLARVGAIDEYRLILHPVTLAAGLPLFDAPMDLALTETRTFPAGAVALTYARTPAGNAGD